MSDDALHSFPAGRPVALIDLVETNTREANRAFVAKTDELARGAGGATVLANEAVVPMIVPDERAQKADDATGLLVVHTYPTPDACRSALDERAAWEAEAATRSWVARPAGPVEAFVQRTLPAAIGLLTRTPIPTIEDVHLESLIDAAHIVSADVDTSVNDARWTGLTERAGDRPIWMLNFLEFAEMADYPEEAPQRTGSPIDGARAYERYGRGMVGSLGAVGGRVGWSARSIRQVGGSDDGRWHQIAIAVYPSPIAMMTMLSLPGYRAAHVHREAGLARTRLLATQPID